jgi:hypothetical protein
MKRRRIKVEEDRETRLERQRKQAISNGRA